MSTTLTIRTDKALRAALEARARAQARSVSEVAREILSAALDDRPLGARTGHVRGSLRLSATPGEGWRRALRERNWRP